jgi:hypothetical protein
MSLFNKFLGFLEKHGRKKVLVDYYGNVMMHRYFVFYNEDPVNDKRWISKLPNIYIHQFIRPVRPDGGMEHEHPWSFISYIVSGSYVEVLNGKEIVRKAGNLFREKNTDVHTLVEAETGTTTIFFHGFRKGPWFFKPKKCETLCETCAANFGKCYVENQTFEYNELAKQFDTKRENQWRAPTWFDWSPDLEKKLERRRLAAEKISAKMPANQEERVKLMLKHSKMMVDDSKVTKLEI